MVIVRVGDFADDNDLQDGGVRRGGGGGGRPAILSVAPAAAAELHVPTRTCWRGAGRLLPRWGGTPRRHGPPPPDDAGPDGDAADDADDDDADGGGGGGAEDGESASVTTALPADHLEGL